MDNLPASIPAILPSPAASQPVEIIPAGAVFPHPPRRWPLREIFLFLVFCIAGVVLSSFFLPAWWSEPHVATATVRRGTVVQTVDVVGTVKAETDLGLRFQQHGKIHTIRVKVGDTVKRRELLAQLDDTELAQQVNAAEANVRTANGDVKRAEGAVLDAEARLRQIREGARTEDVSVSEAGVAYADAAVRTAQTSIAAAQTSLENARMTEAKERQTLESLLRQRDTDLRGKADAAFELAVDRHAALQNVDTALGALMDDRNAATSLSFLDLGAFDRMVAARARSKAALAQSNILRASFTATGAVAALQNRLAVYAAASEYADRAFEVLQNTTVTSSLTAAALETLRTSATAQRRTVTDARGALTDTIAGLQNAEQTYRVQIAQEQQALTAAGNAVQAAREQVQVTESRQEEAEKLLALRKAELTLKRAAPRDSAVQEGEAGVEQARARQRSAEARLDQVRAALAIAQKQRKETKLYAPIDGTITNLPLKEGEVASEGQLAVQMMGDAPLRVEARVADVDIPQIQKGQKATFKPDAFQGTHLPAAILDIDPSAQMVEGVPKYKVTLTLDPADLPLRDGQTGDITIETARHEGALFLPQSTIVELNGTSSVRIPRGKGSFLQEVQTGMASEADTVEILSGVQEGQEVILSPGS